MQQGIVILGSSRRISDTKKFTEFIFHGTDIIIQDLLDYNITPYDYENNYPSDDTFMDLVNIITKQDKIIFATPVYWYAMSGNMKVFFDRLTDLVTVKKEIGRKWKSKNVYMIAVGSDPQMPEGFEIPFRLTSEYFNMNYKGCAYFCNKIPFKSEEHIEARKKFLDLFSADDLLRF